MGSPLDPHEALHDWLAATASLWLSLVVGLLGGLASAMLTQYVVGRREAAARSYQHRREAYVNFYTKFYEYWRHDYYIKSIDYPDPDDDYLQPLYDLLMQIQIFGNSEGRRSGREGPQWPWWRYWGNCLSGHS